VERERVELFEYASTEAVRALLPILDDFERGWASTPRMRNTARHELIYQRFYDSLKRLGLEPIVSVGRPFDPNIHHAN